jgi:hypothetical protein
MGITLDKKSKSTKLNNIIKVKFSRNLENIKDKNFKFYIFNKFINIGAVRVVLDATQKEANVPPEFSLDHRLKLDFSYTFNIPDFKFNTYGVSGTLNFPYGCYFISFSWNVVYGMQEIISKKIIIF